MTKQVITTSDVAIKQATVEIKVLKIGNKQVTQAVFKQLPEVPIIHEYTGRIIGDAWGRVNYHVDCHPAHEHFHVVWQQENQLYRSVVNSVQGSLRWVELNHKTSGYATAYVAARVLEGWRPEAPLARYYTLYPTDDWGIGVDGGYKGIGFKLPDCLTFGWYRDAATDSIGLHQDRIYQIESTIEYYEVPNDSEVIREKFLVPALYEQRIYESIWQQSYDQLQQLDQLFIAV